MEGCFWINIAGFYHLHQFSIFTGTTLTDKKRNSEYNYTEKHKCTYTNTISVSSGKLLPYQYNQLRKHDFRYLFY